MLFIPFALLLSISFPDFSLAQKKPVAKAPASKTPAGKAAAGKTAPSKSAASKAPAAKSGASKSAATKSASGKKGTLAQRKAVAPRRMTQQQPGEDRVREIQQALTEKGYNVDVNGVWGPESTEALKKFQEDQNINNMSGRGKLDSLTLIALGLGPKREPPPQTAAPVQPKAATEGKLP
ncbi:peptidoglycan-binding domain-containing protein [Paludibaculum fermentans]|uniref:Peptidoglycan-binding protein n=1 Tax=Paludibaculum fermentans TaxID=1473598 RepID=A0A7S7NMH4_PALFE|nr:peptidoglycan-binding domain-containing protein [Paludibaculum fermentans]QOY86323.1 peptidoglycan-binding protein [Paludibaculum fermentans]